MVGECRNRKEIGGNVILYISPKLLKASSVLAPRIRIAVHSKRKIKITLSRTDVQSYCAAGIRRFTVSLFYLTAVEFSQYISCICT